MPDYLFPTSGELHEIAQDYLPQLVQDRPVFQVFPMVNDDQSLVMWEQEDDYTGLQQARGLDGQPPKINKLGGKRFSLNPGVYGEYSPIDETEITLRRQFGTFGVPVDISALVMREQRRLLGRRLDRVESIVWTLLSTGTFAVPGPSGAILHTDSYLMQTYAAPVTWATSATAAPLADFRAVQLRQRGHSVSFGPTATAWMNQITANRLFTNSNNQDIYGRRTAGLGTYNSEAQLNQLLAGDGLPTIRIYDGGYKDETQTFQPFIGDGVVIVVGKRSDGAAIGEYKFTRNATNANAAAGPYMSVVDTLETTKRPPRQIEVHDGHNGGCALYFPSAIVRMNV